MKKTLRTTILLSVFGFSTASLFAASTIGAPRPQSVSVWSTIVSLLGL